MTRILRKGMTGSDVKELQSALNYHIRSPHTPLKTDGIFGDATESRVKLFQGLALIDVDGVVGRQTTAALYRAVEGVIEVSSISTQLLDENSIGASPLQIQDLSLKSAGFDEEKSFLLVPTNLPNPLANQFRLTLTTVQPWPVTLPEPLELDSELDPLLPSSLKAKLKYPYKYKVGQVELKPYFYTGVGIEHNGFSDLSLGGGGKIVVKIFGDLQNLGFGVHVEGDGGLKIQYDFSKGEGMTKGYYDIFLKYEVRF